MGETKFHEKRPLNPNAKNNVPEEEKPTGHIVAQFQSSEGDFETPALNLPIATTTEELQILLNQLLNQEDDPLPYSFFVDEQEIVSGIYKDVIQGQNKSTENVIKILYQPQAIFKVRAVTRCSSTLSGHTEAILSVVFSPDGSQLASGSGDKTVRIWDLNTETPQFTLTGHTNWVETVAWSPDGNILASGGMDKTIRLWNPKTGKPIGDALKAHRNCITSISWEPMHSNAECNRFASSSKDGTVKIWDAKTRKVLMTFGSHTAPVMCVKWGGEGLIYSASRDKTIKVWDAKDGKLVRSLDGHGHWVNHLALSTEFILRSGCFDHKGTTYSTKEAAQQAALQRYLDVKKKEPERLVSCSDDFTMFLWEPFKNKRPIARMTGHQQPVNHVSYSPDGRLIASASFDKSIKLWDGKTGKFITTLRGHVGAVYQVCWSSDSRMLLSGSKDSTLKIWDLKNKKLKFDLPGHQDEVFSVDWSPKGDKVASGGKDRKLKIWKN